MLESPSALVYGVVIVGAILDAESVKSEKYADTVGAVLVAMILFWLAHSYAEFAGARLRRRESLRLADLASALAQGLAILAGAAIPLAALMLCWAAGAGLGTAVDIGIYSSAGLILIIEMTAAVRADLTGIALVVQSLVGALLGGLMIALKLILH